MTANEEDALPNSGDSDLRSLLDLSEVGLDRFTNSHAHRNPSGVVFGGQLIGQALMSALRTVDADRLAHSIHATFLRPGNVTQPLEYAVERMLDGGRFSRRRVLVSQEGREVLSAEVSCHTGEDGDDYSQTRSLDLPMPDELPDMRELVARIGARLPWAGHNRLSRPNTTVDMRIANIESLLKHASAEEPLAVWLRCVQPLPDDARWNAAALGYLSDFTMASPFRMMPNAPPHPGNMVVSTLDHSLWLHRAGRPDQWLLMVGEIPTEQQGRRLNRARFFDIEGRLVATSAQEQVIRLLP